MKKKVFLTLILVVVCMLLFGAVSASAVSSGICGDNITWTLDDSGTLTIRGSGAMTNWGSYSSVPWYRVRDSITNVVINSGVTSIGTDAFIYCSNMTSVNISNSVTSIGGYAFMSCSSLTNITIPDSVTSIGDCAFLDCSGLANITIPDSVTSIGDTAFGNGIGITGITIHSEVEFVGEDAFSGCTNLSNIIVDENNNNYCSISGNLFNKDKTVLIQYAIGKQDHIYVIPDGVTTIGRYSFSDCVNLTKVIMPDSIETFDAGVFHSCTNLKDIVIPDGVTIIPACTFVDCTNLESITIPKSITTIDFAAFSGCTSLTDVYYNGTESEWESIYISPYDNYNDAVINATIHYNYVEKPVEYRINSITIKDMQGNELSTMPEGTFLATISFTNVSSSEDAVIVLAQYSSSGAFKGLMYIQTEDVPIGSTIKLSIPVGNTNGDVAKLKAFCWTSFSSLIPMGNSVSFPNE